MAMVHFEKTKVAGEATERIEKRKGGRKGRKRKATNQYLSKKSCISTKSFNECASASCHTVAY